MGWRAILIFLTASCPLPEGELLPIRTYTTADGVASDHIDCIAADSRGFLWFCTPEGLSRFDGYRFVNYGGDKGLPHPAVSSLIETAAGDFFAPVRLAA
jgi:ligand-binding sensor domain-containing protein